MESENELAHADTKPPWQRSPNPELWASVNRLSQGDIKEKIDAVEILWSRHYELPEEAVPKVLELAARNQPRGIRLRIAQLLQNSGGVPWGLVTSLTDLLTKDPDEEVRRLAETGRDRVNKLISAPLASLSVKLAGMWTSQILELAITAQRFASLHSAVIENLQRTLPPPELLANISRLASLIQPITKQLAETAAEMSTSEFQKFEAEMGWMEFLPMSTFWNLYLTSKTDGVDKAWKKLVSGLRKPEVLHELLSDWGRCRLMSKRTHILELGLDHHAKGDAVSAISVLLPQVEGLVWDMGVELNLVDGSPNSKAKVDAARQVVVHTTGKRKDLPVEWCVGELVGNLWGQKRFEKFFKNRVYSKEFRHPILHGRRLDMFTGKESTAVILYLMAIQDRCAQLNLC